jgi:hypothetical protein
MAIPGSKRRVRSITRCVSIRNSRWLIGG